MRLFQIDRDEIFRPLKAHEIVILYLAASSLWHYVFTIPLFLLPNINYFEYPATALTVLYLMEFLKIKEKLSFDLSHRRPMFFSSCLEIIFVFIALITTGVGAWSVLVFLEAKIIDPNWSYTHWNLIDSETFRFISWDSGWLAADLICLTLVGPINEELIFRGIILKELLRKFPPATSILASSIIFSVFHLNHSFLGAFFHSVLFSIIAIRFSSLYAPIFVHGAYNFTVAILRSKFGISLIADFSKINTFLYWENEFLFLAIGSIMISGYFVFFKKKLKAKN